jgi:hypothetical protein
MYSFIYLFFSRHNDLVNHYRVSVSQIITDMFCFKENEASESTLCSPNDLTVDVGDGGGMVSVNLLSPSCFTCSTETFDPGGKLPDRVRNVYVLSERS